MNIKFSPFKIFLFLFLFFNIQKANACDRSNVTIVSSVENDDGTYTYLIKSCVEMRGMEQPPRETAITVNGTSIITFSPTSISPASGYVFAGITNSENNVLSYTCESCIPLINEATHR